MYIRSAIIKFLKVKNILLNVISIFMFAISAFSFVSLLYVYWGDCYTILNARSTPTDIFWLIASPLMFIHAARSKKRIGEVYFFNSYFEGNLSGIISYKELSDISGISERRVATKLKFFSKIYMSKFTFEEVGKQECIVLYSKKVLCSCRQCGAHIGKRVYFTGKCEYCGSSDISAQILTANRFYCISNNIPKRKREKREYTCKNLSSKKVLFIIILTIAVSIATILGMYMIDNITKYNDAEYLKTVLFSGINGLGSYELIKQEIMKSIMFAVVFAVVFFFVALFMKKRIKFAFVADENAPTLADTDKPFIDAANLPTIKKSEKKMRARKDVKEAICHNYLTNCAFEMHDDGLKIAVARKVVKDRCITCGAPIVGAVDEKYRCNYCGNIIMGVVKRA